MRVRQLGIAGVFLFESSNRTDNRGFFVEAGKESVVEHAIGRAHRHAQTNHSRSAAGTLRGFRKEPWDKLIYVAHGTALCAVVDTRADSADFGSWETVMLGDAPGLRAQLFVPVGVSNAFYCLTEVDYINVVSEEFRPHDRSGFVWDDPDIGVAWPDAAPILSETDRDQPRLRTLFPDHPFFHNAP